MKKTTTHRTFIRFRRWSRSGYAMFSSLGRCVTIGSLKKGVADASLKKQKSPVQKILLQPADEFEKETNGTEEDICGVLFQSCSLLVQSRITTEIYGIGFIHTQYQETGFAGWRHLSLSGFLFSDR